LPVDYLFPRNSSVYIGELFENQSDYSYSIDVPAIIMMVMVSKPTFLAIVAITVLICHVISALRNMKKIVKGQLVPVLH
jgi:hypothetical protein